jgi:VanZ family protein
VTLEVGTVASDVRMFEQDPWRFTVLRDEGIVIILSAFFSSALASYLSVLGEARAGLLALAVGAVAIAFLEGSQLLIGSRSPSLWDLLVGWTGLLAGLALWRLTPRIRSGGVWLAILAGATFIAAAMQMLTPFEIASEYRPVGWFPLRGYYTRTTFETLSHVIELALLYVPLGFFAGSSRAAGASGATGGAVIRLVALTVLLAGVVEYLQGWIVGRYPDVSDVGLCVLGALGGWWAAASRSGDTASR